MIKILTNDFPDKEWNDRLIGIESATELQTKEYATYVKTELNWKPKSNLKKLITDMISNEMQKY